MIDDRFDGEPTRVAESVDGRRMQTRQQGNDGVQVGLGDVELEQPFLPGRQCGVQKYGDLIDFLAFPGVGKRRLRSDKHGVGLQEIANDSKPVSADRRAGLGDLDGGISQAFDDLGLRRPQENSTFALMPRSSR